MKRIVRKELEDSILKLTYEDRIQIGRIRTDENMTMWYGSFPTTSAALCSYHHSKAVSLFRDFTDTKYDILMGTKFVAGPVITQKRSKRTTVKYWIQEQK